MNEYPCKPHFYYIKILAALTVWPQGQPISVKTRHTYLQEYTQGLLKSTAHWSDTAGYHLLADCVQDHKYTRLFYRRLYPQIGLLTHSLELSLNRSLETNEQTRMMFIKHDSPHRCLCIKVAKSTMFN